MRDLERYERLLARLDLPQASRKGTLAPVLEIADRLPRGPALDVPSGAGAVSGALLELGFDVTAGDLDEKVFQLHGRVAFRAMDLDARFPFDAASFGLIHCGDGVEHLENPFHLFRECSRVLQPGGSMIVTTPNYLAVRRRLQFLFTGALERPLERRPGYADGPKQDRGHINPITLTRLAYMAENANLELVETRTISRRLGQSLFALPVAVWLRLLAGLRSAEQKRRLFLPDSGSLKLLIGGRKLIAVFRKAK